MAEALQSMAASEIKVNVNICFIKDMKQLIKEISLNDGGLKEC